MNWKFHWGEMLHYNNQLQAYHDKLCWVCWVRYEFDEIKIHIWLSNVSFTNNVLYLFEKVLWYQVIHQIINNKGCKVIPYTPRVPNMDHAFLKTQTSFDSSVDCANDSLAGFKWLTESTEWPFIPNMDFKDLCAVVQRKMYLTISHSELEVNSQAGTLENDWNNLV